MYADRNRLGLLVSGLGAILLAIAVFLPWYALSLTSSGVALIEQVGDHAVATYGNATLQGQLGAFHAHLGELAGHQLAAVSAHQVLHNISPLLLAIAVGGVLVALAPLARADSSPGAERGLIALLGAVAALLVIYRMALRPGDAALPVSLSLREGAWLALLGSLAMVGGALVPRQGRVAGRSPAALEGAWADLSGWTPES